MSYIRIALVVCVSSVCVLFSGSDIRAESDRMKLSGETIWNREEGAAKLEKNGEVYSIANTGSKDWAIRLHEPFPVNPGEAYLISVTIEIEGEGDAGFTVALRNEKKEIIDWSYGNAVRKGDCEKTKISDYFVVPSDGASLEPRLVGHRPAKIKCSNLNMLKLENVELLDPEQIVPEDGPVLLGDLRKWNIKIKNGEKFAVLTNGIGKYENLPPTFRIEADNPENEWEMFPDPIKCMEGERYLVNAQVRLESGKLQMHVLPWKNGLMRRPYIARGTFAPDSKEEGDNWCEIHAYLTIPEGIGGFTPVISGEGAVISDFASVNVSRAKESDVNPVRKKVQGYAREKIREKLDRGLIAVRTKEGVYLSWRILENDPENLGFDVYRIDKNGSETKINSVPITETSDFSDENPPEDEETRWYVKHGNQTSEPVKALDKPYISIPLKEESSFIRIAFADLDGDGKLDHIVRTPNSNIDPYINYWKPSPGTYNIQAYRSDGEFMWERDLGWNIEQGIWYSPALVADLDGDGCAEIVLKTATEKDMRNKDGRVYSGEEYLSILDGKTGKERVKIDWPERAGLPYNLSNRHQLCLAYLDGKTPCLIVLRGTYSRMVAVAYQMLSSAEKGDRLEELWRWDNRWEQHLGRWGQGAHTTHAFDLDGDGRDEVILGSIVLDDDGSILWETKLGHPDHFYLGDLNPERPGLEILYGIESRRNDGNGICMVDAKTGEILWKHGKPTVHIHSSGMCSDIDARFPGCESWAGERDSVEERWLRTAKSESLEIPERFSKMNLAPKTVWWDADLQRELIVGSRAVDYPSFEQAGTVKFEGSIRLVADVIGDWREEVVVSHNGEIRIYTTNIPARDRRTTFFQDANYRATLHESMMGYPQTPLPSYDLDSEVDNH